MVLNEANDILTISNVISPALCNKLIEGYLSSPPHWRMRYFPREASMLDLRSEGYEDLWRECFEALSPGIDLYKKHYFYNETIGCSGFQVVAYHEGEGCLPHYDGMDNEGYLRFGSVICYLNVGFQNGRTLFRKHGVSVTPEIGKMLVFPSLHTHPHESEKPVGGIRYVLLSGLLYGGHTPLGSAVSGTTY